LGNAQAHYHLAGFYHRELGVEKDEEKEIRHLEEAAIGGHPLARQNLGSHEWKNGNIERAVKHRIIAATQGCDDSMKSLMIAFRKGHLSKEQLDATLRAHHAAVNATKSPQRLAAEKAYAKAGI
jgi:TPR repeat protein